MTLRRPLRNKALHRTLENIEMMHAFARLRGWDCQEDEERSFYEICRTFVELYEHDHPGVREESDAHVGRVAEVFRTFAPGAKFKGRP